MPEETLGMRANIFPRYTPTAPEAEGVGAGGVTTDENVSIVYYEGENQQATVREVASPLGVFIWQLEVPTGPIIQTIRLRMRANIRNTVARTMTLRANITDRQIQQMTMRGRILPRFAKTLRMRGRIRGRETKTMRLRASIFNEVARTMTMRAMIRRIQFDLLMRARITQTISQTMTMRAKITDQIINKIDMMASIRQVTSQSMTLRAWIRPFTDLLMRALIQVPIDTTLEVEWNTAEVLRSPLLVTWNAGDMQLVSQVMTMRARIASPRVANLEVEWQVPTPIPSGPSEVPTQRIKVP